MEYLLKSSGILLLFYMSYKLFLENETFFTSNRWFFLMGIITSLVCPLLVIPIYTEGTTILATQLPTATTITSSNTQIIIESFDWVQLATNIYLIGVALFLGKLIINLISLLWLINKHPKKKNNAYTLIETKNDISPFSFFHFIVFNPAKYKTTEIDQIILHEKVHAYQRHSIDILLSQLLLILCWFNPIAWLYKNEIAKNLEFIADEETIQHIKSRKEYQHLLVKTSLAKNQLALTNSFNNSFIKKRITMLQKNKSSKRKQWKYTLILPIIMVFVFAFNTEKIVSQDKMQHLQNRFNGTTEIITKDASKKDLEKIKVTLESSGIGFNYSNVKRNKKNEIIKITLKVRNKKSSATATWENNGKSIPDIEAGTNFDNNAVARSISNRPIVLGVKSIQRKSSSEIDFDKLNILQKDIIKEINALISIKKISFFVKDSKVVSETNFKKLGNKAIKKLQYLESEEAITKYGQKAKNGAIIITTKKK